MVLRRKFWKLLLFAIAAIDGCAQVQTNNAGKTPMRAETTQDDVSAELLRGLQYSIGPSKDSRQAFAWFLKAANQGNANAEYNVAQSFEAGRGVQKNETEAIVWYRKAAEQGLPIARAHLRSMFINGQLIPVDDGQGGEWWQGLVQQAADESQSFLRTYAAAAQGDADAELQLGIDYLTGVGVRKDRVQATSLFQQAAGKGQLECQCLAAAISASDDDWTIPAEMKLAGDLCLNAANHGSADAQLVLSAFYTMGRGVPKDATQAAFWHRKAAEMGRRDAEFLLAYDYERGNGVPVDTAQSLIWMRKAADQREPTAMLSLGIDASLAHITGKPDPLGDPGLAKNFSDWGIEYGPDTERDLLRNMWASRAEEERGQQFRKQWSRALAPTLKAIGEGGQ
jgi:uncharacterized protein